MNYSLNTLEYINFKKAMVNGYSKEQVDNFIKKTAEDYMSFNDELSGWKSQVAALNKTVQQYKAIEETLQQTLLIAQQSSENITNNAFKRANNIIIEAEIKAKKIISDSNQDLKKIKIEYEDVKKRYSSFKEKSEALLLSHLEELKKLAE